jgi:anti-sigma factor RsiW
MRWHPPTPPRRAPISCDDAQESVSARLDREAPPVSDRAVQRHLAACPTCHAYAQALGAVQSELQHVTRQARLRSPRAAPPHLAAAAIDQRRSPHASAPVSHRTDRKPALALAGRYAAAVTPIIAAIIAIHIGLPSHINVAPTHPATPCTQHLTATHGPARHLPYTRSGRDG